MNAIQKAAFAASALAITLVGAALATAPMAFARATPVVTQATLSAKADCANAGCDSGLVALNHR